MDNSYYYDKIYDLHRKRKTYLKMFKLQLIFYPIGLLLIAITSSWFTFPSISSYLILSFVVTTIPFHRYFFPVFVGILEMLSEPTEITEVTVTEYSDGRREDDSGSQMMWDFILKLIVAFLAIVLMLICGALSPIVMPIFLFKYYKAKYDIEKHKKSMRYYGTDSDIKQQYDFYINEIPYQYHDALAQYLQKRLKMDESSAYKLLMNLPACVRSKTSIGEINEDFIYINELITTVEGIKYLYSIKPHNEKEAI